MKLILIVLSIILTYLVISIYKTVLKEKYIERAIERKINEKNHGYFSARRIKKYLKSRGFLTLNPMSYILFKFTTSILFCIAFFINYGIGIAIIMTVIGFFLLDITIELGNKKDNKEIVADVVRVFDSIKIQTSSGAFISDALKESYLIAKNGRFKKALGELSSELTLTNNLINSMDEFNSKFKCKFIDIFCLAIKQGNESGQINSILEDISSSIKEIDLIIQKEQTEKVKLKTSIIQILVYIGILAIVIYGLFNEISASASIF